MAEISQIKLPNGTTYDIKDATARAQVGGAIILRGTTTTALTDEATTNPITINGSSYTAVANDAVFYNKKEFVFDGTKWHEFGDMSGLGALATKDSASGTVAVPKTYSFSGTGVRLQTDSEVMTGASFSGSSMTSTGSFTPTGTISKGTGTANYTPEGSVSTPTISVKTAGTTTSVTPFGSAGSLPSATMPTFTVASGTEVLTITAGSFSAGSLPSGGTPVTVKTGDAAYQATQPEFQGTGAELKFTGSSGSVSVTGTTSGSISPTKSNVTVSPAGSGTATYTPSGSVATATTENKTVTVS